MLVFNLKIASSLLPPNYHGECSVSFFSNQTEDLQALENALPALQVIMGRFAAQPNPGLTAIAAAYP